MAERINHVWFNTDKADIVVARVQPYQAKGIAGPILRVMADAYQRQFEAEQSVLPAGSSYDYFEPNKPNRVQQQAARMEAYINKGSSYWVAYLGRYSRSSDEIVGMIKTSPSKPTVLHRARLLKPNCYVNDVATVIPRIGIGSALLKVALDDYDRALSSTATDVLPGSERFFESAGMVPVNRQPESFETLEIGGVALHEQMTRYGTPYTGMVKFDLMQHNGWLAEGIEAA